MKNKFFTTLFSLLIIGSLLSNITYASRYDDEDRPPRVSKCCSLMKTLFIGALLLTSGQASSVDRADRVNSCEKAYSKEQRVIAEQQELDEYIRQVGPDPTPSQIAYEDQLRQLIRSDQASADRWRQAGEYPVSNMDRNNPTSHYNCTTRVWSNP